MRRRRFDSPRWKRQEEIEQQDPEHGYDHAPQREDTGISGRDHPARAKHECSHDDQPTDEDRYRMIRTYFEMLVEEELPGAAGKMKQFAGWFTHGVVGGAALRKAVYEAKTELEILGNVERFFENLLTEPKESSTAENAEIAVVTENPVCV